MPVAQHNSISFFEEWDKAAEDAKHRAIEVLKGLGRSEAIVEYISTLRIYPRIPYLCSSWISDPAERNALGVSLSLHAMGLKLLDDLVDADTEFGVDDLVAGHVIAQAGVERFYEASKGQLLTANTKRDWLPIWRYVIDETLVEMRDLTEWVDGCRTKSLLYLYVEALYRDRMPEACDELKEAIVLMTCLGQIVDDGVDQDMEHESSNIVLMIRNGQITQSEASSFIVTATQSVLATLTKYPPALDFSDFIRGLSKRAADALNSK